MPYFLKLLVLEIIITLNFNTSNQLKLESTNVSSLAEIT